MTVADAPSTLFAGLYVTLKESSVSANSPIFLASWPIRRKLFSADEPLRLSLFNIAKSHLGDKDNEGALRARFECRQVNELFRDPPPTLLSTLETLAKLEVTDNLYSMG